LNFTLVPCVLGVGVGGMMLIVVVPISV